MKQVLGFRLSRQAKFWLSAGGCGGDLGKSGQPSYKVLWWSIEELEEFLDEVWCGAYAYKGYILSIDFSNKMCYNISI